MTTQDSRMWLLQALGTEHRYMLEARAVLVEAEVAHARTKAALAGAERALDELTVKLTAAAPRETCTNETQRKAWALENSREEAAGVEARRVAQLSAEIGLIRARAITRNAEDARRFVENLIAAGSFPVDLALPEMPALSAHAALREQRDEA